MNTVISVRINKELKEDAQAVAESAGLSLSTLINSYLRQVAATRRIELFAPEPMSPHLEKLIAEVEKELASGQQSRSFESVEELIADLQS